MSKNKKKILIAVFASLIVGTTLVYLGKKKFTVLSGKIDWEKTILSTLSYVLHIKNTLEKEKGELPFRATAQAGLGGLIGSGSLVFVFN